MSNQNIIERILDKWARYTQYDPNQHRFNALSLEYEYHKCGKRIERITTEYDQSGTLGVIYAKSCFIRIMTECKIAVIDALREGGRNLQEEREMWDMFTSEEFSEVEDAYISLVDKMTEHIMGEKLLGESSREETLTNLVEAVDCIVETLDSCNMDVYQYQAPVGKITTICPDIHVFPSLATCVLTIEQAPDGAYCCYISAGGTTEGYFGFFIKSNGTIFSVHDRIDEAYIGSHHAHRNQRWTQDKKWELFPYENGVITITDTDYKGNPSKTKLLVDTKLPLKDLPTSRWLRLIIAVSLLAAKYEGQTFNDKPLTLLNTLMPQVMQKCSAETILPIPTGSSLATRSTEYRPSFLVEDILSGSAAESVSVAAAAANVKSRHSLHCHNQILVDTYGQGFACTTESLIPTASIPQLTSGHEPAKATEFVGCAERMDILAYTESRRQLAQHIRDEMLREYISFGGTTAVKEWWLKAIKRNKESIQRMCVQAYDSLKNTNQCAVNIDGISVRFAEKSTTYPDGISLSELQFFNVYDERRRKVLDEDDYAGASLYFQIKPNDWMQLEKLCGSPVPRLVRGYQRDRIIYGNSILEATDMVNEVGTPLEPCEVNRNPYYQHKHGFLDAQEGVAWPNWVPEWYKESGPKELTVYQFFVSVGFSKRHFKELYARYTTKEAL